MSDNRRLSQRRTSINAALTIGLLLFGAMTQARSVPAGPSQYIRFEIRTAPGKSGGNSTDLISIIFSESSADVRDAPRQVFGPDILQEFSFSGREAGAYYSFDREIRDSSFLNARFIRVVNHGHDGWAGESMSISVGDGKSFQPVVDRQSLYPRKGLSRDGAIQDFNRTTWRQRVYWEAELQRIRADRASKK